MNGLVQRLHAKVGFQRVGDAPGQNLARVPIHDCHQIQEPALHREKTVFEMSKMPFAHNGGPVTGIGKRLRQRALIQRQTMPRPRSYDSAL